MVKYSINGACLNAEVSAIQTEAPSRVSFATTANAWIIHDAYTKDQQQKTAAAAAAAASTEAPVLLLQPATGDGSLGCDAAIRLEETARVVERMINQNIYDEIAQGSSHLTIHC